MRSHVALSLALLSSPAWAADPTVCEEPYLASDLVAAMNTAEERLANFDSTSMRAELDVAHDRLFCTYQHIHPNLLTRYGRLLALAYFFDQDDFGTQQWLRMSKLAGQAPWPLAMDEEHPFRVVESELDEPWITGPEGAGVSPPKGGGVFVDGKLLEAAEVAAETPHFLQVFGRNQQVISNLWIDGANLPMDLLKLGTEPPPRPPWYVEPDPNLDPMVVPEPDPAVAARIEAAKREREAMAKAQEERMERLAEQARMEELKTAKLEARLERQRLKREARAAAKSGGKEAVAEAEAEVVEAPTEWVEVELTVSDLNTLGGQDQLAADTDCSELMRLEPKALMGRLSEAEIQCLEVSIQHTERQTQADKISRVLIADAWAKEDPHRWEGAMRRHLETIDQSDAELCFIFSRHLARQGPGRIDETIYWADKALENAFRQWQGDALTKRVNSLYRLRTLASRQKWHDAEQEYLADFDRDTLAESNTWRDRTKVAAREWMMYAQASGGDTDLPLQLCVSAAGTQAYCDI